MAERTVLTNEESRNLIIHSQGLNYPQEPIEIIRNLGYVQIDTLSVAERSHHHVIHTRHSDYNQSVLGELMSDKLVFEYWSHAASVLPMEDYRFSLIRKELYSKGKSHWFEQSEKMNRFVLDRIRSEGPLQSKDFMHVRDTPGAWYDWKPAKIALEQLFMEGELMVSSRKNFQKVYDLTERVLPLEIDNAKPSLDEYCEHLVKTTLNAQGIATIKEIGYLRNGIKGELINTVEHLLNNDELLEVTIDGSDEEYYALKPITISNNSTEVHLLSPFDNLIIQRKRLLNIFKFDYQIECYVPQAKRKFGYYSIPILYGNQFVARFDPKADRKTKVFTINSFWFEPDFTPDEIFISKLAHKLARLSTFCGCDSIAIQHCHLLEFHRELSRKLKEY